MNSETLNKIIEIIYKESNISLDSNKKYLIENRFHPIMEENGIASFEELLKKITVNSKLRSTIINEITTNETYFFRDKKPFEFLKNNVKDLFGSRGLKIWSAACSTGQELYSIAFTLEDIGLLKQSKLVGTDISSTAVEIAREGKYNSFELKRGLTDDDIKNYFDDCGDYKFKVKERIRRFVSFNVGNLFNVNTQLNQYDIIFCRNVAIYFNEADKRKLFERIHQSLKKEGILIIGSTESLMYCRDIFEMKRLGTMVYYIKK